MADLDDSTVKKVRTFLKEEKCETALSYFNDHLEDYERSQWIESVCKKRKGKASYPDQGLLNKDIERVREYREKQLTNEDDEIDLFFEEVPEEVLLASFFSDYARYHKRYRKLIKDKGPKEVFSQLKQEMYKEGLTSSAWKDFVDKWRITEKRIDKNIDEIFLKPNPLLESFQRLSNAALIDPPELFRERASQAFDDRLSGRDTTFDAEKYLKKEIATFEILPYLERFCESVTQPKAKSGENIETEPTDQGNTDKRRKYTDEMKKEAKKFYQNHKAQADKMDAKTWVEKHCIPHLAKKFEKEESYFKESSIRKDWSLFHKD